jgi:hypothetical protein
MALFVRTHPLFCTFALPFIFVLSFLALGYQYHSPNEPALVPTAYLPPDTSVLFAALAQITVIWWRLLRDNRDGARTQGNRMSHRRRYSTPRHYARLRSEAT